MRLQGLLEALDLTALFGIPASKQTGSTEHTVNAAGAYGNNILIKHHEGQTTVSSRGYCVWKSIIACFSQSSSQKSRVSGHYVHLPCRSGSASCNTCSKQCQPVDKSRHSGSASCNTCSKQCQPVDKSRHSDAALPVLRKQALRRFSGSLFGSLFGKLLHCQIAMSSFPQ